MKDPQDPECQTRRLRRIAQAARKALADEQAFAELTRLLAPTIYRVCFAILRNADEAEDCTQEALVRLWLSLPKLRDPMQTPAWARRIAVNIAIDHQRKQARERNTVQGSPVLEEAENPTERIERQRWLQQRLEALSPSERAAFALRLEGASIQEIAQTLGISVAAAKMRLHRAMRRFADSEESEP